MCYTCNYHMCWYFFSLVKQDTLHKRWKRRKEKSWLFFSEKLQFVMAGNNGGKNNQTHGNGSVQQADGWTGCENELGRQRSTHDSPLQARLCPLKVTQLPKTSTILRPSVENHQPVIFRVKSCPSITTNKRLLLFLLNSNIMHTYYD